MFELCCWLKTKEKTHTKLTIICSFVKILHSGGCSLASNTNSFRTKFEKNMTGEITGGTYTNVRGRSVTHANWHAGQGKICAINKLVFCIKRIDSLQKWSTLGELSQKVSTSLRPFENHLKQHDMTFWSRQLPQKRGCSLYFFLFRQLRHRAILDRTLWSYSNNFLTVFL